MSEAEDGSGEPCLEWECESWGAWGGRLRMVRGRTGLIRGEGCGERRSRVRSFGFGFGRGVHGWSGGLVDLAVGMLVSSHRASVWSR